MGRPAGGPVSPFLTRCTHDLARHLPCPSGKGAQSQCSHGHRLPLGSLGPGWSPDPRLTDGKGFLIAEENRKSLLLLLFMGGCDLGTSPPRCPSTMTLAQSVLEGKARPNLEDP